MDPVYVWYRIIVILSQGKLSVRLVKSVMNSTIRRSSINLRDANELEGRERRKKWKFKKREREKEGGGKKRGGRLCLPVAERNRVDGIISHSPTSWTSLNDNAACIPNGGLYSARDVTRGAAMWTRVGIFFFSFLLYFSTALWNFVYL